MGQMHDSLRQAKVMGQWLLDMDDARGARVAIDSLPLALRAAVEVRQTLWSAQVRTDSDAAAVWLTRHYAP